MSRVGIHEDSMWIRNHWLGDLNDRAGREKRDRGSLPLTKASLFVRGEARDVFGQTTTEHRWGIKEDFCYCIMECWGIVMHMTLLPQPSW